jgi:hypothetical protein
MKDVGSENFRTQIIKQPIPVATLSKANMVLIHSNTVTLSLNLT